MNRSSTFGVIGGAGSTGKAVAWRSTDRAILIDGSKFANLEAVAADVGAAVSAVRIDVRDPQSLEKFCNRCSVLVNSVARVSKLKGHGCASGAESSAITSMLQA